MPYDVLIVDERAMPRLFFECAVSHSDDYRLSASIQSPSAAAEYCSCGTIDLVLMEIVTSTGPSGLEAAAQIKRDHPEIRVILTTAMADPRLLELARAAGADSFWYKEVQTVPILEFMDRTMAGEHIFPEQLPPARIGLASTDELTAREIDVLRGVAAGSSDIQIARQLGLRYNTVRVHIGSLLQKTGCASRTQLAIYALRAGAIVPEL